MRWLGSLAASFASWLWACSPKPQDPLALPTQGHAVTFGVLMQVPPGAEFASACPSPQKVKGAMDRVGHPAEPR
jgi:hypothetical protein